MSIEKISRQPSIMMPPNNWLTDECILAHDYRCIYRAMPQYSLRRSLILVAPGLNYRLAGRTTQCSAVVRPRSAQATTVKVGFIQEIHAAVYLMDLKDLSKFRQDQLMTWLSGFRRI